MESTTSDPVVQVPESPAKKSDQATAVSSGPTSSFGRRSYVQSKYAISSNGPSGSTSASSDQTRPFPILFGGAKPLDDNSSKPPPERLMSLTERFSYNGGASGNGIRGPPAVPGSGAPCNFGAPPQSIFARYNALLSGTPPAQLQAQSRQAESQQSSLEGQSQGPPSSYQVLMQRLQATHPHMPPHMIRMAITSHKSYESASMWLYNSAPYVFGTPPPPPPTNMVIGQQQVPPQHPVPPPPVGSNMYQGPLPGQLNAKREVSRGMSIREKFSGYTGRRALPNAFADDYRYQMPPQQKIPVMAHIPAKSRRKLVKGKDNDGRFDYSDSEQEDEYNAVAEYQFELRVLEFINTAKPEDIKDISACEEELVQTLIANRPYATLQQARAADIELPSTKSKRRGNRKTAGEKVVDNCSQTLKGYEAIDSLIQQCDALGKQVAEGIKKWGINVLGDSEESELSITNLEDENSTVADQSGGYFKEKPKLLAEDIELKDYQQVGVNWMNLLYKKGLSCILADEMGLGKTCQVIAFLSHLKEIGIAGPHLVVVPASTLENWLREFKRFCPALAIEPYYGSQSEREDIRDALSDPNVSYDVLVTTYNLACGSKNDTGFLKSRRYNVVAYDEGHLLKNSQSERYAKLMKLKAKFRLLLTGTPLQNNLKELVSLLSFILPDLFEERRDDLVGIFKHKAKASDNNEETNNLLLSEQRIVKAKKMLFPFILRRKKEQVLKHLPEKTHAIEYCDMLREQEAIYQKELENSKTLLELSRERAASRAASKAGSRAESLAGSRAESRADSQAESTVGTPTEAPASSKEGTPAVEEVKVKGENKTIGNILMQLRKAAIHPLLFRTLYTDDKLRIMAKEIMQEERYKNANEQYIYEDMEVMNDFELNRLCEQFSGTIGQYALDQEEFMKAGKVAKLAKQLPEMKANGDRILIFSQFTQMLDILERVLNNLNIAFLRLDGSTPVEIRQDMIDKFHTEEDITVFLLSTKAGGFGINLACANKVIIHDLSFNPHDDNQAEDRCHRVGQTRPVNVVRMITRDTIEENILALANTKLQLDRSLSEEGNEEKQMIENESLVAKMLLKSQQ